jgi:hypothetical protein
MWVATDRRWELGYVAAVTDDDNQPGAAEWSETQGPPQWVATSRIMMGATSQWPSP